MNKTICIIPARKGSKRIKGKNSKFFYNKPIIAHVIEKLKKFNLFDKIIVSTNCNYISKIAKKLKVEVLIRSEKLADEKTDTVTVIADVVKKLEKRGIIFNKVFCVYPTSVFIKTKHITLALRKLKKKIPYVFSAKKYDHPIFRSFYKNNNNSIVSIFNNNNKKSTQKYRVTYHDAAQFYLGWKDSWKKKINIFNTKSNFILMSKLESHDIDDIEDWKIAKSLWKLNNKI